MTLPVRAAASGHPLAVSTLSLVSPRTSSAWGQNSETFLENYRARATRLAQFDYLDGMLGPPNAAAAGLARWCCEDQAVLRPDGDCWSDLSYYELPGSRPTRWMYENLMSFFSVLKNMFSARGKALALYKRAMKKAEHRDFGGAIADYTTVVQLPKGKSTTTY